ncbi:MAG: hypothetical protein H5T69_16515 [Chloroflexi bacterium]|nr:hypothetical protein [Chloroflexota bacterium]
MINPFALFQVATLALFLLAVLWRTISLWRQGIRPLRLGPIHDGENNLDALLVFLGTNLWILLALDGALPSSFMALPSPWGWRLETGRLFKCAGVLLQASGLLLFWRALHDLGSSWRLGIDMENPGTLVTAGIYRHMRNPIYLFFDLFFLGGFLLQGMLALAALGLALGLLLHRLILREERFLARVHGAKYMCYVAQTSRYLPWGAWAKGAIQRAIKVVRG